jgi:ATP-binding cassette subfamily B protein
VVYVIMLASATAVLGGHMATCGQQSATERLMELLVTRSTLVSPSNPVPAQLICWRERY